MLLLIRPLWRRRSAAAVVAVVAMAAVGICCAGVGAASVPEVSRPGEKPLPPAAETPVERTPAVSPERLGLRASMAATARLPAKPPAPGDGPAPSIGAAMAPAAPLSPADDGDGESGLLSPPPVAAPEEVAALSVMPQATEAPHLRIGFAPGSSELAAGSALALDRIASRLAADETLRLQLVAYAAGGDLTPGTARRLALARALAVRGHLIDRGIASNRMDVRALGDQVEDEPFDRVDLSVVRR
ncbi:MAG: hypothetical protein EA406_02695 [Rhodospirillales bacterium]|nr:MAG: hypothetical protein EA406_02695 [Rhodospirillales bacterium]